MTILFIRKANRKANQRLYVDLDRKVMAYRDIYSTNTPFSKELNYGMANLEIKVNDLNTIMMTFSLNGYKFTN